MDTKWKKSKRCIAALCFGVGMSLLNLTAVWIASMAAEGNPVERAKDAESENFQNTSAFQYYMEGYLQDFLGMATGGPVSFSWNQDLKSRSISYSNVGGGERFGYAFDGVTALAEIWDVTEGTNENTNEAFAEEAQIAEDITVEEASDGESSASFGMESDARKFWITMSQQDYTAAAEAAHAMLREDRNILYRIDYDGQQRYTNADGTGLDGEKGIVPEGYNFLMYFDGDKVFIQKDGRQVDVYGNGEYRSGQDWFVPGYENFPVNDKYKKARVTIAVRSEPQSNAAWMYGQEYGSESRMYRLMQETQTLHTYFGVWKIGLQIAGILLFFTLFMGKARREAAESVAAHTGKLWFEARLAMVIIPFVWMACILYGPNEGVLREPQGWEALFRRLAPVELLCFWGLWLYANDRRFPAPGGKNSLFARLRRALSAKRLSLPVCKRLLYGYRWVLFFGGMETILFAICLLAWKNGVEYGRFIGLFWMLALAFSAGGWIFFQLSHLRRLRSNAEDMGRIVDQVQNVKSGDMNTPLLLPEDADLGEAAAGLNEIREGMKQAVEEQVRSERMKVELIANVSHDIKTPLTSIISYVELLKEEEGLPAHIKDYICILDAKSQRLKTMVQDVFEVSRAASGELPIHMERIDFAKLLRQTMADMEEQVSASSLTMRVRIPDEEMYILADGQRMYRVFQNLILNALKYSLEGSRVYLTLKRQDEWLTASVANTSASELSGDVDYTARFTRGDNSRSDGGSGLGLSIARSFTEACGGKLEISIAADLFTVTVKFTEASPSGHVTEHEDEMADAPAHDE